ncbi:hypothetical protein ACFZAU_22435 [Streptomyces sp. NPDC008238]
MWAAGEAVLRDRPLHILHAAGLESRSTAAARCWTRRRPPPPPATRTWRSPPHSTGASPRTPCWTSPGPGA